MGTVCRGFTTGKAQFPFQVLCDGGGTANMAGGPLTNLKVMPTSRLQSERGIESSYTVELADGCIEGGSQFAQRRFLNISELILKLMQGTRNHARAPRPSVGYFFHAHDRVLRCQNTLGRICRSTVDKRLVFCFGGAQEIALNRAL
jgi:hypothetical protein